MGERTGTNGGGAPTPVRPEVLAEIASAIQTLRYGAVEITVHEARVVQIERREKIRFGQDAKSRL